MNLRDLSARGVGISCLLLQTPSVALQQYIQDALKSKYKVTKDAIISIDTKSDLKKIKDVIGVKPPFSDKWYVQIDLGKFNDKSLPQLIQQSGSCVFLLLSPNYGVYKNIKKELSKIPDFRDMYVTYLKRSDFIYLYDRYSKKVKLSKPLLDWFIKGYSGDIDSVFTLFGLLKQGEIFNNRQKIANACGLGSLSVEGYIFDLLKPLSGSAKGFNLTIKNRIKTGIALGENLDWATLYNFINHTLKCFCHIKMLMMSGVIYRDIRKLPSGYDEKALYRYQRFIWRLKEIPLSEILILRQCVGNRVWRNELGLFNFVYNYYALKGVKLLNIA